MPQAPDPSPSRRQPVFISFASEDLDLANQVLASLEAGGIRCWIAHRDIGVAQSYPAAISAAVESSGALLLLLTEHSNRSPHVRREVEMAFNARTPILPVRMSGILPSPDLAYFLSTTQWLDAGATFDADEAARLRVVLERLLDRKAIDDDAWERRRRRRRRMAIAIPGGAIAIVMALLIFYTVRPGLEPDATRAGEGGAAADRRPPPADTTTPRPGAAGPEAARPAPDAIRTAVNPRDGATYVWIPPGEFVMGCSAGDADCDEDEQPVHRVAIGRGFWLARTEVTAAQYNTRPGGPPVDGADGNVAAAGVNWAEAKRYCDTVGGRLPAEAEWEYAARAGTTTRFYGPPADVAWYETNSDDRPHPVGMKAPNAFGLYDMLGNVAEWVRDRYYNRYDDSGEETAVEEPLAPNATAVARGGHWASEVRGLRVSRRLEMVPEAADPIFGFRCAHDTL
jgi:formylglycine-generating enzyme required for sulfatase activity